MIDKTDPQWYPKMVSQLLLSGDTLGYIHERCSNNEPLSKFAIVDRLNSDVIQKTEEVDYFKVKIFPGGIHLLILSPYRRYSRTDRIREIHEICIRNLSVLKTVTKERFYEIAASELSFR